MLGTFGFARVLNARTARSQCTSGMVWCIDSALNEALLFDPVDGHLANCDLAEYHVPVHCGVPEIEVLMVERNDPPPARFRPSVSESWECAELQARSLMRSIMLAGPAYSNF